MQPLQNTARLAASLLVLGAAELRAQEAQEASTPRLPLAHPVEIQIASLPQPTASLGACVSGSWIYAFSGHIGRAHAHSVDNLSTSFARMPIAGGEWEELPGVLPLQSVALVPHRDKLLRIGGMTAHNRAGEEEQLVSTASVAIFDTTSRTWTEGPALPEPRSSHDAFVDGAIVWVAGGWKLAGGESEWHDDVLRLDLSSDEPRWESIPQPFRRRAAGVTAAGGKLYLLGGIDTGGETSSELHILDAATETWSLGPDLPCMGFAADITSVEGEVYASGIDGVVYRLNEVEQRWEETMSLGIPRFFHQLVPAGRGRLAAIGGANDAGHLASIEVFDVPVERKPSVAAIEIPTDFVARQRQGVLIDGWNLVVVGGNRNTRAHRFEPENFLNEAWRVSLDSGTVERIADFPRPRQSMSCATVVEAGAPKGYVLGGFGHEGDAERSRDGVYVLDFDSSTWAEAEAKLPRGRTQFGLAQDDGDLWVFGGVDFDPLREGDRWEHTNAVLRWTPGDPQFTDTGAVLPKSRRAFGGAKLNGRYYLVGGLREDFEIVSEAVAFDFDSQTFEPIAAPRRPRISPHLVPVGRKLYLFGGSSSPDGGDVQPDPSVEVYDPASDAWTLVSETLPLPAHNLQAFPWHDGILLYSADDDEGLLRLAILRP